MKTLMRLVMLAVPLCTLACKSMHVAVAGPIKMDRPSISEQAPGPGERSAGSIRTQWE